MVKNTSRLTAVLTLHQLQLRSLPLPILFEETSSQHRLSGSDRGLAMNLIYGVLRQRDYLDSLIQILCRQPVKKLHPLVYHALCIGLYQIFFLDRIPESAAVNETVNAARAAGVPKRLHGFINGVLRQSIRQRPDLPGPDDEDNTSGLPALNHPEWMVERWQRQFGREEMIAICRQNNIQQGLTLRINATSISRQDYLVLLQKNDIEAEPGKYSPDALLLRNYHGSIAAIPGYTEGYFQVQDEAAQLASYLLKPFQADGYYLDGCAGLGGKTGHLLQLLHPYKAHLTAVEPEPQRLEKLTASIGYTGKETHFDIFPGTLAQFALQSPHTFHGILIDAPCSGTGVTGRHPDIRWHRSVDDINRYAKTQLELLTLAASLLRPGGILVYATCSLEPEENTECICHFLAANSNFSQTECSRYLPEEAAQLVRNGFFQPLPSQSLDGFFAARLVCNSCNA